MNYYYFLPQDIISKIEGIVEDEELIKKSLEEWKTKMMSINKILTWTWDTDYYTEAIEEGEVINDILDNLGMDTIKSWIKGMEKYYCCELKIIYIKDDDEDED